MVEEKIAPEDEVEEENVCLKCKAKLVGNDAALGFCMSCRTDRSNEAYLDYGAFIHINEQCDRHNRPPQSYDDTWERELWEEGVYE